MDIPTCNYKYLDNEFYVKSIKNDNYVLYVFGFVISISAIGCLISIYNVNLEYKQELSNKIKIVLHVILILIFLGLFSYSIYEIGTYNTKDLTTKYKEDELIRPCYSKNAKKIYGFNMIEQETKLAKLSIPIIKFYTYSGKNIDSSFNLVSTNGGLKSYSSESPILINAEHSEINIDQNTPINQQNTQRRPVTRTVSDPYNTRTSTSLSDISGSVIGNDPNATGSINATADSTSVLGSNVQITNNSALPSSTIGTTNVQQMSQNSTGTQDQRIVGNLQDGDSLVVSGR